MRENEQHAAEKQLQATVQLCEQTSINGVVADTLQATVNCSFGFTARVTPPHSSASLCRMRDGVSDTKWLTGRWLAMGGKLLPILPPAACQHLTTLHPFTACVVVLSKTPSG